MKDSFDTIEEAREHYYECKSVLRKIPEGQLHNILEEEMARLIAHFPRCRLLEDEE